MNVTLIAILICLFASIGIMFYLNKESLLVWFNIIKTKVICWINHTKNKIIRWIKKNKYKTVAAASAISLASVGALVLDGGEETPEIILKPYIYTEFIAPVNSFGMGNTTFKEVNWTFWQKWFNNSISVWLEKSLDGKNHWTDCSKLLIVDKDWNEENISVKLTFHWVSDEDMYYKVSYKLKGDSGLDSHYDESSKVANSNRYILNCSITDTESYNCFYDWSDYKSSPESNSSIFSKEIVANSISNKPEFYWTVTTDTVIKKGSKFSIDPTFGETGTGNTLNINIEDALGGGYFQMGGTDGTVDSITAHMYSVNAGNYIACIHDDSSNLVCTSAQRTNLPTWTESDQTFTVSGSPSLTANAWYYISVWASTSISNAKLYRAGSGGYKSVRDSETYDGTPPNPASFVTQDADGLTYIYCTYTESASNNAPTISGISPVNESTGISISPTVYAIVTDADSDTMTCNFYTSNNGVDWTWRQTNSTVSTGTNISYVYSGASSHSTKYYWKLTADDGTDNTTSDIYEFTTEEDTITFNFIEMTPADILITTEGTSSVTYNITTGSTGINGSSVLVAHLMNQTEASDVNCMLNTSYVLDEADWLGDDPNHAGNRHENYWFDSEFNITHGDGTLGYGGQWRVKNDSLTAGFVVNSQGSNWYNFTCNVAVENTFGVIELGKPDLRKTENKTGQYHNVFNQKHLKIDFNLTNTCLMEEGTYNNTNFGFHINAEPVSDTISKDLLIYFTNQSYEDDRPWFDDYCELIGSIDKDDPYDWSPANSNYYHVTFSTDENGYVGTVKMDSNFSIIVTSRTIETRGWNVFYANDYVVDGDHVHDFENSTTTSIGTGWNPSYSPTNGTIDCFFGYAKLSSTSEIFYKVYAQMNGTATGDGQWSTIANELIDEVNIAPNCPDVLTPNGTAPTDFYSVGDTINISYNWLGDPNHETCWVNITAHDSSHNIAYWLQNRSITSAETHVNNTWYYDWDTTGVERGTYHINITVTDPDGLYCGVAQNGTFDIGWTTDIRNDGIDYFTYLGGNISISTFVNNITGFDESSEYIGIWDNDTWSSTNATWKRYNGDGTGIDFTLNTFDVVQIYLTDSGTQVINMSANPAVTYTGSKSYTWTNTSVNKGYNFTSKNTVSDTTLSLINTSVTLQAGEFIALWNKTNYAWDIRIADMPLLDRNVHRWDIILSKVEDVEVWNT